MAAGWSKGEGRDMEMKMKLTLILIAMLLVAAAPNSWWDDLTIMTPRQVVSYQLYFNPSLKYAIEYTGSTWTRCYFTMYEWSGATWIPVPGMSGNVDEGEILAETSTRPELRCYQGTDTMYLTAKSPSLIYPKIRVPNPGWPMAFVNLLLKWGPAPAQ